MPTTIAEIEAIARERLVEPEPNYWTSEELTKIIILGIKDLWRAIVDLKAEHYLTVNDEDVYLKASTSTIQGVPNDVHKVYMIEPLYSTLTDSSRSNMAFTPKEFNHPDFNAARMRTALSSPFGEILYAVTGTGAPFGAPTIRIAPQVDAEVRLSFAYVPTMEPLVNGSYIPIPGEGDAALVAWTVAFARAKETEDHAPDQAWIGTYGAEKANLLQSLGLRQLQEDTVTDGIFDALWT